MESWTLVICAWIVGTCWGQDARSKRTVFGVYPRCPEGCTSCSSANGCVTCESGLYLYIQRYEGRQVGACVEVCPRGHYSIDKQQFSVCKQCPDTHCESCSPSGACTKCRSPLVLYQGGCREDCPEGLYTSYMGHCVVQADCMLSDWGPWSPCTRNGQTCGYKYGSQARSRDILQDATPGGAKCDVTSQTRRCRLLYRHCSDLLSNSSDPPKRSCPRTKREKRRWERKHKKPLPKQCRSNRKRSKGKKHKRKDKKHKRRNMKKEQDTYHRESNASILPFVKHSLLLGDPNIKTNDLDEVFRDK